MDILSILWIYYMVILISWKGENQSEMEETLTQDGEVTCIASYH